MKKKVKVAATSLLADHGYSDFNIEKRAAIAEVSRTSIYCGEDVLDSLEYYLQLSVVEFSSDSRYNALKPIVAEAQTDLELDVLSRQRLILP